MGSGMKEAVTHVDAGQYEGVPHPRLLDDLLQGHRGLSEVGVELAAILTIL